MILFILIIASLRARPIIAKDEGEWKTWLNSSKANFSSTEISNSLYPSHRTAKNNFQPLKFSTLHAMSCWWRWDGPKWLPLAISHDALVENDPFINFGPIVTHMFRPISKGVQILRADDDWDEWMNDMCCMYASTMPWHIQHQYNAMWVAKQEPLPVCSISGVYHGSYIHFLTILVSF